MEDNYSNCYRPDTDMMELVITVPEDLTVEQISQLENHLFVQLKYFEDNILEYENPSHRFNDGEKGLIRPLSRLRFIQRDDD
jgi:hypothetical protein